MKRYIISTSKLNELMCVSLHDSALDGEELYDEVIAEAHSKGIEDFNIVFDYDLHAYIVKNALSDTLDKYVQPYLAKFGVTDISVRDWHKDAFGERDDEHINLNVAVDDSFVPKALQKIKSWKDDIEIEDYLYNCVQSRYVENLPMEGTWEQLATDLQKSNNKNPAATYLTLLLYEKFGDMELQEKLEEIYITFTKEHKIAWYNENN